MTPDEYQKQIIATTQDAIKDGLSPAAVIATLETTKHTVIHMLMDRAKSPAPAPIVLPNFRPPTDLGGRVR